MMKLTHAEIEVLASYARNHKHYYSFTLDISLKRRGYLGWKNDDFDSGVFDITEKGREALLAQGVPLDE